jgi:hypothetical protein
LQSTDSAFCAFTDFRQECAITVDAGGSIDAAIADMIRMGVHALLVTEEKFEGFRGSWSDYRLILAIVMVSASIGCSRRRKWGWRLAVTIFVINGLSDAGQILMGHILEGAIGVAVAGAILFYLSRPTVRETFT